MRLVIYAVNVHQGGGAVLLNALLTSIDQDDFTCIVFLDRRLKLPVTLSAKIQINRIAPSIFSRLLAERILKNSVKYDDVVLCFGNLPPLFKLDAKVILFIQNRYLIDDMCLKYFNIKARLRITLERIWLKLFCKNVDTIIVQTPSMQSRVSDQLGCDAVILPFFETTNIYKRSTQKTKNEEGTKYDFLYVASGEPHKNHKQLVEAWVILAAEGIYPMLCLTLNEEINRELVLWIRDIQLKYDLKIVNAGFVAKSAVTELYTQAKALIYPSTFESFGLPLIEARNANLAIIASELDYVRDVLNPEETFDPSSPKSIARAVKRFLGFSEKDLNIVDPKSFVDFCINSNSKRN